MRTSGGAQWCAALLVAVFSLGCKCEDDEPSAPPVTTATAAPSSTTPSPSASAVVPEEPSASGPRIGIGSSIARSADAKQLFALDEINSKLHVVALPLTDGSLVESVALPGRPAQVVVSGDEIWVTIREPSLLWTGKLEAGKVSPVGEVKLPGDAWGLAVDGERRRALVSSAWTSQLSWVDLQERRLLWSGPVAREPRGVVIEGQGRWALVSHLVGSSLTKVMLDDEGAAADSPNAPGSNASEPNAPAQLSRVVLPAAPLRTPATPLAAALGYAGVISPDGKRYFTARHALGALGKNAWFGAASVDVLALDDWTPLAPPRPAAPLEQQSELASQLISGADTKVPGASLTPFVQPRALLYRASTDTLLVAGEGDDRIAELDARALDPTMAVMGHYAVGSDYHPTMHVAKHCAAPSGMVLSPDESVLWVYCGATNDLAEVRLVLAHGDVSAADRQPPTPTPSSPPGVTARLLLAEDPLGPGGATGRKLFYNSTDFATSGGLGCAGCHPEGRDDGHVWHEASFTTEDGDTVNFVGSVHNIPKEAHTKGYARRTPMLAGRVNAVGPYGWHAESPTIEDREAKGFSLHRWGAVPETSKPELDKRARALFDYLRRGLVPPLRSDEALSAQEARGQELFLSQAVGCVECHDPKSGYTTRKAYPLPLRALAPGFDEDTDARYKIPGLTFLAGRAPYFHDGSAASLEELIESNGTRMGNTASLNADDRAALVAFLKTL